MKSLFAGFRAWLIVTLCVGAVLAGASIPSLNAQHLAQGKYSSMHMLLEKTVLKVDVLTVDIRVGKKEQAAFTKLASGKQYSAELANQLADVAVKADNAVVQLTFARNVGLNQWIDAVRTNLRQAREAGLISAQTEKKVSDILPQWFAVLSSRGFHTGDRVLYGVEPSLLRVAVVDKTGNLLVAKTDKGEGRGVIMASYFAPASEFREPLLRSLLK